jgi:hypothetical protein
MEKSSRNHISIGAGVGHQPGDFREVVDVGRAGGSFPRLARVAAGSEIGGSGDTADGV